MCIITIFFTQINVCVYYNIFTYRLTGSITKQASLEESVQMDTPPRSPPEPPPDKELLEMVGAAPVPTQLKERPEMTAKQRWHWAYNQIVMQLRVSNYNKSYFHLIVSTLKIILKFN